VGERSVPQFDKQRMFGIGQGGGGEHRAIKQAPDLVGGLALSQDEPRQKPVTRGIFGVVPGEPPAKPGTMAQERIELREHSRPIAVVKMAARPEEG
jgi:hypothetical protein